MTEQRPLLEESGRGVKVHSLSLIQNQQPEGATTGHKYLTEYLTFNDMMSHLLYNGSLALTCQCA